jgi:hypothetical protein
MNGMSRKQIHSAWYPLSNNDFKILRLRTTQSIERFQKLTEGFPEAEFWSSFEIDGKWVSLSRPGGSALMICRFGNCLSVSSFILGKLRGATYICFDDIDDLPYLWLQKAKDLPWMQGLHEHIRLSGSHSQEVIDMLRPFLDKDGTITKMDTLDKIQIGADEQTYSFDLSMAYPAMMMAQE